MYRPDVRLEAVTLGERASVVAAMDAAIGAAGGWIQDSNFFADISVAIRCGVPQRNLADLLACFGSAGLKFDAAPLLLDQIQDELGRKELNVSINVTFA